MESGGQRDTSPGGEGLPIEPPLPLQGEGLRLRLLSRLRERTASAASQVRANGEGARARRAIRADTPRCRSSIGQTCSRHAAYPRPHLARPREQARGRTVLFLCRERGSVRLLSRGRGSVRGRAGAINEEAPPDQVRRGKALSTPERVSARRAVRSAQISSRACRVRGCRQWSGCGSWCSPSRTPDR